MPAEPLGLREQHDRVRWCDNRRSGAWGRAQRASSREEAGGSLRSTPGTRIPDGPTIVHGRFDDEGSPCHLAWAGIDALLAESDEATLVRRLGAREREAYADWAAPSRRRAWLAARLLAKRLIGDLRLAAELGWLPDDQIEIDSRLARGRSRRPTLLISGRSMAWDVSISHGEEKVVVSVTVDGLSRVGVDIVPRQPVSAGFRRLWFTSEELEILGEGDRQTVCRAWAVKEAVFKAVNLGERFAPRSVRIERIGAEGFDCCYRGQGAARRLFARWVALNDGDAALVIFCPTRHTADAEGSHSRVPQPCSVSLARGTRLQDSFTNPVPTR